MFHRQTPHVFLSPSWAENTCFELLILSSFQVKKTFKSHLSALTLQPQTLLMSATLQNQNSDSYLHFSPDGILFAAVHQPRHPHPHRLWSSLSSSSQFTPTLTARSAACAHSTPSSRPAALRDAMMGSWLGELRPAGKKQKPEKCGGTDWTRLPTVVWLCLSRMLVGKQGELEALSVWARYPRHVCFLPPQDPDDLTGECAPCDRR